MSMRSSKIIHGDSFDRLDGLPDAWVDVVMTDPPYDLTEAKKAWLHSQFRRISRGWIIVFAPPENQWIQPASQYLFWVKPISTKNTSRRYSRFVEMIAVYGTGPWDNTRHWSQYTNVFHDLVDHAGDHPYRKPPGLIERLVRNHTRPGDVVLDPFCGSGTIPIVCQALGRVGLGIEQDAGHAARAKQVLAHQVNRLT